jgi:hypothetical protein
VLEQLLEDKGDSRSAATADTNATLLERHLHSNRKMTQVLLSLLLLLLSILLLAVPRGVQCNIAVVITVMSSACSIQTVNVLHRSTL